MFQTIDVCSEVCIDVNIVCYILLFLKICNTFDSVAQYYTLDILAVQGAFDVSPKPEDSTTSLPLATLLPVRKETHKNTTWFFLVVNGLSTVHDFFVGKFLGMSKAFYKPVKYNLDAYNACESASDSPTSTKGLKNF